MKQDLQRIETALHQLNGGNSTSSAPASATVPPSQSDGASSQRGGDPSFSMAVQPFPAHKHHDKTPTLPKLKPPSISTHRHGSNPALAMNLLKEIEEIVASWQKELQSIVRQIQDIYIEGPIVDGWLESHARSAEPGDISVRPAERDRLMDYVEETLLQPDGNVTYQSPRTGYRLCGLDAAGRLWSRPCPPEQVPSVSVAIARHQKLRQLLSRKQDLETRLSQLSETLVVMHSHLSRD